MKVQERLVRVQVRERWKGEERISPHLFVYFVYFVVKIILKIFSRVEVERCRCFAAKDAKIRKVESSTNLHISTHINLWKFVTICGPNMRPAISRIPLSSSLPPFCLCCNLAVLSSLYGLNQDDQEWPLRPSSKCAEEMRSISEGRFGESRTRRVRKHPRGKSQAPCIFQRCAGPIDFFLIDDNKAVVTYSTDGFRELTALCGKCL